MSNFTFCCPHCKQRIEADESMRGELANCPCCNEEIVVDELSSWEEDVVAKESSYNLPKTTAAEKKQAHNDNQPIKDVESSIEGNNIRDLNQSFEIKESLPDKKKSKVILISVLIAIPFLLLVLGGISFILYQQRQAEAQRQAETQRQAEFQMRLKEFAIYGHELQKKLEIGVLYREFGDLIAKVDSQWRIFCEITPKNHPGRSSIDKAIKTLTVCHEIWALKIKNIGSSYKSYNLNSYDLSYEAETFLKTEVYPFESYSLPYKPYDKWISILLGLASLHYQRGYMLLSGKEKANIEKTKKLAEYALVRCIEKMPDQVSAKIASKITLAKDKDEELLWTYIFAMERYDSEHQ